MSAEIVHLEDGIRPIYYGKYIVADEMYFDNPIVQALATLNNPWNMQDVISALTLSCRPTLLTRQVNCLKYNYYDQIGYICHRLFTIENEHLTQRIISSPFKSNFTDNKQTRPDSFIESDINMFCFKVK